MKQKQPTQNNDTPTSDPLVTPLLGEDDEKDAVPPETREDQGDARPEALAVPAVLGAPAGLAGSGSLDRLVDTAKDYARQATAENTNAAYKADWAHFSGWCRRRGADPLPPSPELIGLYIANCASPDDGAPALPCPSAP